MPWFYVDDGFSDCKPVEHMPAGPYRMEACGLWVTAGSWSAKEELDGFVPLNKLRELLVGYQPAAFGRIIRTLTVSPAPLCNRVTDPAGIQFNNWPKWQQTRAELAARRKRNATKQAAWRARNKLNPPPNHKGRGALTGEGTSVSPGHESVMPQPRNPVTNRAPRAHETRPDPEPLTGLSCAAPAQSAAHTEISPHELPPGERPDWLTQARAEYEAIKRGNAPPPSPPDLGALVHRPGETKGGAT